MLSADSYIPWALRHLEINCVPYFCRDCVNHLKQRKGNLYCGVTKWIALNDFIPPCAHCRRIRRARLTVDGLRLIRNGMFVDKNNEERMIYQYYGVRVSRARRRLSFN